MCQNGTDKQTDSAIVNVNVNINLYSASSQKNNASNAIPCLR